MLKNWKELFRNMPLDDDEAAIEDIARRVVNDGVGSAAIVFLESSKPFGFIAGQATIAATPLIGGFIEPLRLEKYAERFGNRDFIERLIRRIEELEAERAGNRQEKDEK